MKNVILYHNNPLDINEEKGEIRMVKVPDVVYQIFFDIAQSNFYHNADRYTAKLEDLQPFSERDMLKMRQSRIFKVLSEWVHDNHPGYGILNFIDLNRNEAARLTEKMRERELRFDWGMYVFLKRGAVTHITDIHQLLTGPQTQDNGNQTQKNDSLLL